MYYDLCGPMPIASLLGHEDIGCKWTIIKNAIGTVDIDLCGLMSIVSLLEAHYFMTFTNDYNYYTWVYFIKQYDEVFRVFKQFKV
jgi:hypothetical protein